MKKFFTVLLLAIFCATTAMADDIIVKTDGTAVAAKVIKVDKTQIEYKKASNPNGPSYTMPLSEILSINYENGEKETFATQAHSQEIPSYRSGGMTKETATSFSNDQQLLNYYNHFNNDYIKKGKRLKKIGLIGGGILFVTDTILSFAIQTEYGYTFWERVDGTTFVGPIIAGAGLIGGVTTYLIGNNYCRKGAQMISSYTIVGDELDLGGARKLNVGLSAMNTPYNRVPTFGVSLNLSF